MPADHPIVTEEAVEVLAGELMLFRFGGRLVEGAYLVKWQGGIYRSSNAPKDLCHYWDHAQENARRVLVKDRLAIQKQVEERVRERLESLPRLIPTTSHGGPDYQERDRWAMVEAGPMCKRDGYLNRRDVIDALDSKKQGE